MLDLGDLVRLIFKALRHTSAFLAERGVCYLFMILCEAEGMELKAASRISENCT